MVTEYREYIQTDLVERLNSLYKKLNRDNYDNLVFEVTHNTFLNIVYDVKRYFYERLLGKENRFICYGEYDNFCLNSFFYGIMNNAIEAAFSVKTFEDIFRCCGELSDIVSEIDSSSETISSYATLRYAVSHFKSAYALRLRDYVSKIPKDILPAMFSARNSNDTFRFLDCAVVSDNKFSDVTASSREGITIESWKQSFEFYGISRETAMFPGENYKKVIKGSLETCNITAKSFDVIHSICPLTYEVNVDNSVTVGSNKNYTNFTELLHIRRICSLLKEKGIVILHLPFYVMSNDFCKDFAKRFTEISVIKESKTSFPFSLITLVARKRSNNETDGSDYEKCYQQLRNIIFNFKLDYRNKTISLETDKKDYILFSNPDSQKRFVFIGTELSPSQLRNVILNNPFSQKIYHKKEEVFDKYANIKPLLPFTNGQLGLVLVSGFCDGIIEEDDGSCHVVKGRSSKYITTDATLSEDIVTMRKNYSNKVEINIFESDGVYRSLI